MLKCAASRTQRDLLLKQKKEKSTQDYTKAPVFFQTSEEMFQVLCTKQSHKYRCVLHHPVFSAERKHLTLK